MKRLPNGHLLCPKCGKDYAPGGEGVLYYKSGSRKGKPLDYCRSCKAQNVRAWKRTHVEPLRRARDARFGAPTAEESRRRTEARRRLEELADLRSVDFSIS